MSRRILQTGLGLCGRPARRRGAAALGQERRLSAGKPVAGDDARDEIPAELSFAEKAAGVPGAKPPPRPGTDMMLRSGLGGLLGAGLLSAVHFGLTDAHDMTLILGSFGASSVLLFAAPAVPFSQPRNVIGGHLVSAFVGVSALKLCGGNAALAVPLACGMSIMAMQATNTLHPPAGGTTLIAVLGSPTIAALGYGILVPTALGSSLLVATAVAYNNTLRGAMRYPQYWY